MQQFRDRQTCCADDVVPERRRAVGARPRGLWRLQQDLGAVSSVLGRDVSERPLPSLVCASSACRVSQSDPGHEGLVPDPNGPTTRGRRFTASKRPASQECNVDPPCPWNAPAETHWLTITSRALAGCRRRCRREPARVHQTPGAHSARADRDHRSWPSHTVLSATGDAPAPKSQWRRPVYCPCSLPEFGRGGGGFRGGGPPSLKSRFGGCADLDLGPIAIGFVLRPVLERAIPQQPGRNMPSGFGSTRVQRPPDLLGLARFQLVETDPQSAHCGRQVTQVVRQIADPGGLARLVGRMRPDCKCHDAQGQNLCRRNGQARQQDHCRPRRRG